MFGRVNIICKLTMVVGFMSLAYSCANRGIGPQGGPKDSTPPVVVKETPANGSVNFNERRVEIFFNEYIQLDKVSENVLISPPQQRPPEVKAYGKKVMVTFDEDLRDSTTYTIDFGSAICDNNEKNPINGYSFAFATGDVIDSLEVSGQLLNAEDLNPLSGIVVGIHQNPDDSALTTIPFTRIAKTDKDGFFNIKNIHPGAYRIYALGDVSKDYVYQPGEGVALYDSIISPFCNSELQLDTVWKDSLTIDTIKQVLNKVCEPADLVLMYFKENKQRQYFQRAIRDERHFFHLYFAAPQDSLPIVRPLPNDTTTADSVSVNPTKDTITYWLTDSLFIMSDTLTFELTYQKSDSVYELQWQKDTIYAVYREPRISEKAKAKMELNKQVKHVEIRHTARSPFEIYAPLVIKTETPVKTMTVDSVHLYEMLDTVPKSIPFEIMPVDSSYMLWQVTHDWKADTNYKFEIDSAAVTDIYDNVNEAVKANFKTRTLDEYSSIIIKIDPFDERAMLQILDDKDKVIKTLPAVAEGTKFEYLSPKSYYLRIYLDLNGDSIWTTGDFATHRHPEPVYYFSSKLTLRANWDFEETFEYLTIPVEKQKPKEIKTDASKKK